MVAVFEGFITFRSYKKETCVSVVHDFGMVTAYSIVDFPFVF